MPLSDDARLAVLESKVEAIETTLREIKAAVEDLNKVAQQGGGAFHAILLLGGVIGWAVGIGAALYEAAAFAMTKH